MEFSTTIASKEDNMKGKKHTEEQILKILKEGEAGVRTAELCRKHNISDQTYYKWKSKYGGLELSELKRLRALEAENQKLKHLVADLSLDNRVLKDLLSKNF